jgi:hypothetical protein
MLAILTIIPLEVSMRKSYWYFWGLVILLLGMGKVGQAQDSLGMRCVSTLDYWGTVDGIQMVGDMAYVVSGNKFHIVSLADPANPVEVEQASWSDSWDGNSVYVIGNLAYVDPGWGVTVYDVSDPAHLVTLANWQPYPGAEVEDFMPLGNIAVMKIAEADLCIVDISDLGNIHTVGFLPSSLRAVGMVGNYLCLRYMGLSMWDISDPTLPMQVAEVDTQFWFWGKAVISGNYVYAGTWEDGLRIINVSNPLQPFEVGSCDSSNCPTVTVTGNHAIVSKGGYLNIWNVANPAQPVFESTFGGCFGFSLASSANLVGAGDPRIHEPALMVVDITNPQAPVEASTFGTKGFFNRIAISGTTGYLAGGGSTLHTVDLSNPTEASELGISNEESSHTAYDIAILGNYAYTACGTRGFFVFDISNPVQPDFVTAIDYPTDDIWRLATAGDYLYVSDSQYSLRIYSLTNPAAPESVNSITCSSLYCAANGYLYLDTYYGFAIYSLSNPTTPQLVGSCNLSGVNNISDLVPAGNYIYIATGTGGLRVVDASDPTHPTEVGSVAENTWLVATSGNTLMTFGPDGLRAKDITDRLNPVTVGYYYYPNATTIDCIQDIDILGSYLLTAGGGKFQVFQYDTLSAIPSHPEVTPNRFYLYPCFPNPFNSSTVIRFSLPYAGHAKLTIYDVNGRLVKMIANKVFSVGENHIIFNASDLSSGVYFIRLEAENQTLTEKLVLLK